MIRVQNKKSQFDSRYDKRQPKITSFLDPSHILRNPRRQGSIDKFMKQNRKTEMVKEKFKYNNDVE